MRQSGIDEIALPHASGQPPNSLSSHTESLLLRKIEDATPTKLSDILALLPEVLLSCPYLAAYSRRTQLTFTVQK